MLELTSEILALLEARGTLVVPSRQRAAAVRLAHAGAMLRAGLAVWDSPDVLPWQAWLERALDEARGRGLKLPRRLRPAEEWLLWREALHAACADIDVLLPEALIDAVRSAAALIDDWQLQAGADTPEAALLLRARRLFRERCRELDALDPAQWPATLRLVAPLSPASLAGFGALLEPRRGRLAQYGVQALDLPTHERARVRIGSAADTDGEITAVARWCHEALRRDPAARLLVVVPQLSAQRALLQRRFAQILAPDSIATGAAEAPLFAFEGGEPLSRFPLVAAALQLLALADGTARFAQLSALLRSPYIGLAPAPLRARLDVWLRERNADVGAGMLRRLLRPAAALGEDTVALLRALLAALELAPEVMAAPAWWAQRFATLLKACGWPGARLGSEEQQVRLRFEELLGDFAGLGAGGRRLARAEAVELLRRLADGIAYEPASEDLPVTVTASLADPIVRYDGIWVTGLSADAWPPPPAPDALLPPALQLAAGVPQASAAGQLALARAAIASWRAAAGELTLSYARADADLPRDASALLLELEAAPVELPATSASAFEQVGRVMLESYRDARVSPWPVAQPLPGGTYALELQSSCPFRAQAQLRLRARPLETPRPGIDPRVRGQLLHRALELFWQDTEGSNALRQRGVAANATLVRQCVQRAADELQAGSGGLYEPALLAHEQRRAQQIIGHVLEWEQGRAPFSVQALEWPHTQRFGELSLNMRLDRVDRLDDGALAVLDYKSGAAEGFDAHSPRPPRVQLPAYAIAAGDGVAAAAMLYVGREGVKLRGLADRAGRLPGVPTGRPTQPSWPQVLEHWRALLQALATEFAAGEAGVTPLPHVCRRCHLHALCRIDSLRLLELEPDEGAADD